MFFQDLEDSRGVSYEEAATWAKENNLMFIETSAATGEKVEEAFMKTSESIFQKLKGGCAYSTPLHPILMLVSLYYLARLWRMVSRR